MSKLMLRLVPDEGPPFMAVFNLDPRAVDNLQLAVLRTPGLMSGEAQHHIVEALLTAEEFQYEEHMSDEEPITTPQNLAPPPESPPPVDIITRAAEAAHEANRAYCREVLMDNSQVPWAEAPQWQKDSAIAGVNFAIANKFPDPEVMHINWMKDKVDAGWKYGPVKDPGAKTHPSLRPYDEIPEVERAKDKIFRETIMASLGVS